MSVEVIEKKKRGLTCAECGASVSADAEECAECGSSSIKKSLVVIRKSVADTDDELDDNDPDDVEEDEDLDDDEADDDDEDEEEEGDDEDDEDDEDEEEENEEDEEDDDDDDDGETVKKSASIVGLEALNISTALAQDIQKIFKSNPSRAKYEETMTELNNVMDAAAERWFNGKIVSKSNKKAPHIKTIQDRVEAITNGKSVSKVSKSNISKRADLPEDVRKSLERADRIVEERETEKWLEVAKSYQDYPGDTEELAKTLRVLSETSPKAYKSLKKTLDAGAEVIGKSRIFDSYGAPGQGAPDEIRKNNELISKAQKLVESGEFKSLEAAEVSLMDGGHYRSTNV